ncbi:MAG: rhomboid family intramembrane serine protease [Opitutaceae bacterium]|nr:rhomboid family intramembrane serine protease [Opitutaceae bacterium]
MLTDRPYMHRGLRGQTTSVLVWLLSALAAGHVVQLLFHRMFAEPTGRIYDALFELSIDGLKHGEIWSLFTYGFLHDTGPLILLHLLVNCAFIWLIGGELLPFMGSRRFIGFWFFSLGLGGALWVAAHWRFQDSLIGASSTVAGLITLYGLLNPNQRVSVSLFFLPVTFVMKHAVLTLFAVEVTGYLLFERTHALSSLGWEHSAHLGGMLAGWAYFQFVHKREWRHPDGGAEAALTLRLLTRAGAPSKPPAPEVRVAPVSREDMKAEVDRVLDKINSEGLASLTPDERRVLDTARDTLSKP